MVRRYDDPVEVQAEDADGSGGSEPASFLWRGRLYVVRGVLGHWHERRAWWTAPAARALHGEIDPVSEHLSGERAAGTFPHIAVGGSARSTLGGEHEVWRVEASRGRAFGTGVYDLCRELSTELSTNAPDAGGWRLLAVAD